VGVPDLAATPGLETAAEALAEESTKTVAVGGPAAPWTTEELKLVRDAPLSRGGRASHTITTAPGATVRFAFFAQNGDVGFRIDGAEESPWSVMQRVAPHPVTTRGHVVAVADSVTLTWDNEHAWFTSKTVFFAVARDPRPEASSNTDSNNVESS
jgi:hypothetical protein